MSFGKKAKGPSVNMKAKLEQTKRAEPAPAPVCALYLQVPILSLLTLKQAYGY